MEVEESGMPSLELTEEQGRELRETLESYLSDLRMEIADTDRADFRQTLKRRKELLQSVVDRL
jgi:hypothetical protein